MIFCDDVTGLDSSFRWSSSSLSSVMQASQLKLVLASQMHFLLEASIVWNEPQWYFPSSPESMQAKFILLCSVKYTIS